MPLKFRRSSRALLCLAVVAAAGCASVGPPTIPRDRFDYVASISQSWKRQMLQNLLKLRYSDVPVFLDITQIIAAYSFDSAAGVGGQIGRASLGDKFATLAANAAYGDKPTITYAPLTGDKFARNMMAPLPLSALLFVVQAGYPVSAVFRSSIVSINGLENAFGGRGAPNDGDEPFAELLTVMQQAQNARAFGVRHKSASEPDAVVLYTHEVGEAGTLAARRIRKLLGLDLQAQQFDVVFGAFPSKPTEIAIVTRSPMQILVDGASYIDVPAADTADGRVFTPERSAEQLRLFPPLLRVRTGEAAPPDAYVAVRYRERWFWIDDRDTQSKRVLSGLLLLFSLTETGAPQSAPPLVTVPVR